MESNDCVLSIFIIFWNYKEVVKMSRTYEERIGREINKICISRDDQNQFFGRAIAIQNSPTTYSAEYADAKMKFACEVLVRCGWCNNQLCDTCKLTEANLRAKMDIACGWRNQPEPKTKTRPKKDSGLKICGNFKVRMYTDSKTDVTHITLIPIAPSKPKHEWVDKRGRA